MSDNAMLTTAREWIRLTPAKSNDTVLPPAYWYQEPNGLHRLEAGCNEMTMLPAEALAFASQLPEVKALVEWAHNAHNAIKSLPDAALGYGVAQPRDHWPIRDELIEYGRTAIAPFEEAK